MELLPIILITLYSILLSFIFLYSFIQINLAINYIWRKREHRKMVETVPKSDRNSLPFVTVQLPVFNERYVVERLVDAVAAFDYPRDRYEIQVLDDSTDESFEIAANKIDSVRKEQPDLDIQHIRRDERQGFKAGALAEGMKLAKGEFIAIFDADFVPNPDFLLNTVHHFMGKDDLGVVQTRWEHLNQNYSLLTSLQAFGLDAHFSVEQGGRNFSGHFINFNGTAGVWRKSTIEDAGGWQSDTLTEDLDLSYRAQLKGWKFLYLEDIGSPAELPAAMNAVKTQQFRWTKGAAECTRKNLKKVLVAPGLGWSTKVHALFHLMNSFLFICIISTAVLSVPLLYIKSNMKDVNEILASGSIFLLSLIFLAIFYWVSFNARNRNKGMGLFIFLYKFPMFLSVSMGLSLHNAIAVIEGYIGRKTPFVRTPKFNIKNNKDQWKGNKYLRSSVNWLTICEGLMMLYFVGGVALAFILDEYSLLPFHVLLGLGFGMVFYYSINHSRNLSKIS